MPLTPEGVINGRQTMKVVKSLVVLIIAVVALLLPLYGCEEETRGANCSDGSNQAVNNPDVCCPDGYPYYAEGVCWDKPPR